MFMMMIMMTMILAECSNFLFVHIAVIFIIFKTFLLVGL